MPLRRRTCWLCAATGARPASARPSPRWFPPGDPRRGAAGSQLVCNEEGQFAGSVSGGCVEVAVIEAAARRHAHGAITHCWNIGVSDEQAFSVGLACGGRIRVFVEALE